MKRLKEKKDDTSFFFRYIQGGTWLWNKTSSIKREREVEGVEDETEGEGLLCTHIRLCVCVCVLLHSCPHTLLLRHPPPHPIPSIHKTVGSENKRATVVVVVVVEVLHGVVSIPN